VGTSTKSMLTSIPPTATRSSQLAFPVMNC
jgi:hypothetical protein